MTPQFRALAVDDDDLILQTLKMIMPDQWNLVTCQDYRKVPEGHFQMAFVDMHLTNDMSKREGLQVIKALAERDSHLEIVAMSGDLDRELMEGCLKSGASRFLAKPFAKDELLMVIGKVEALLLMQRASLRSQIGNTAWIGEGPKSKEVKKQIASLRGEPGPILIEGESGSGKEIVSKIIFEQEKDNRPFVSVNMAAIPDNLFESELFGHVKGAFTGADTNKMGLAEAAHGGDLFLDEVEALPLVNQAKLLRFLESGEIKRVGSKDSIKVNVRVIAATNRNLQNMVAEQKFREDLLWRISGKKILLPSLRERKEDVGLLTNFFLDAQKPRHNKTLGTDAIQALTNYGWPGNVRELKRVVEQLCLISPLPIIREQDVKAVLGGNTGISSVAADSIPLHRGLAQLILDYEKQILVKAVTEIKDVDEISRTLDISRSTFYKKIKDHGIEIS